MKCKLLLRLTSLLLVVTFLTTSVSFASEDVSINQERMMIEGVEYIYSYSLDSNGNEITTVTNTHTNAVDVVTTSADGNEFYLNGELIARISEVPMDSGQITRVGTYTGSYTKKITWIEGLAGTALAIVIASVIPGMGAASVIAKIGVSILGGIAGSSTGGVVRVATYVMGSAHVTTYKYVWRFTPGSGETYGPYTSYIGG